MLTEFILVRPKHALRLFDAIRQIRLRRQDLTKPYECPHDRDVDLDGPLAPEYAGKHRHALLRERVGERPVSAPT